MKSILLVLVLVVSACAQSNMIEQAKETDRRMEMDRLRGQLDQLQRDIQSAPQREEEKRVLEWRQYYYGVYSGAVIQANKKWMDNWTMTNYGTSQPKPAHAPFELLDQAVIQAQNAEQVARQRLAATEKKTVLNAAGSNQRDIDSLLARVAALEEENREIKRQLKALLSR